MKAPSQKQLEKWLKKWQKILRLQDWKLTITLVRRHQLSEKHQAEIVPFRQDKSAYISVMSPIDYNPASFEPQDIERSIVHELSHLHTLPFAPQGDCLEEEQAINIFCDALMALDRKSH